MDSSSGLSPNSSGLQNSDSEEVPQELMDQRKRKRRMCNRESARRSRLRKQSQLNNLTAQVARLGKENQQILNDVNAISQHYLSVEAENAICRAQVHELSHRLQSLREIASFLKDSDGGFPAEKEPVYEMDELALFVDTPWNCFSQSAVTAAPSADVVFPY